jgi:hypothetical protein
MTRDDEIGFYRQEKLKFNELLNTLGWTEDYLLKEVCFRKGFLRYEIEMIVARNINSMSIRSKPLFSNRIKTCTKLSIS